MISYDPSIEYCLGDTLVLIDVYTAMVIHLIYGTFGAVQAKMCIGLAGLVVVC